jgi:hypothetical protein
MLRPWLLAAALLLAVALPATGADEPPVKNRPAHFNGAAGSFRVTTEAKPTELRLDQTLTLTVRILPTGPVTQPPRRPNLREVPAFEERFFIENLPDPTGAHVDGEPWEFVYRLKPRDTKVDAIPSLPFIYYKPGQSYQTTYAHSIPLTVKPADTVPQVEGGSAPASGRVPESVYQLAEGPAVLGRPSAWSLVGPMAAGLVLLGTPVVCIGWYLLWRRLYPDAARLARQRRSQAAQHALKALHALRKQAPGEQARQAAAIVAAYLRQRVDLPAVTPTPEEAAAHLRRAGITADATGQVARFFQTCDAVRFAPDPSPPPDAWGASAEHLILTLEAEPCLSQAS